MPENINRVRIVAEIGVNHNGSLDTALKLIYKASEARVDAVKFQKRSLSHIYSKSILEDSNGAEWNFDYLLPQLEKLELSDEDYHIIKETCAELGLDLIITPMDEKSADFVAALGVSAIKIASPDMTNLGLIKKCGSFGLPLIISTGMWEYEDIKKCVDFYKRHNLNFSLLAANSTYPTPCESIGLNFISQLKQLSPNVGYSGHERGIFIPVAAVALGATIIEKHITLSRNQLGPDHKASLLPTEFAQMVKDIRALELSLGSKKIVNQQEKLNRELFAKSAVALGTLLPGDLLEESAVDFKAPGKGIFPHEIDQFYGREVKRCVEKGHYISVTDFQDITPISEWKPFSFSKRWGVKCRFHDYPLYKTLKSPVIEFHCSQTDLDMEFLEENTDSALIVHAPEIADLELVDICSTNERVVKKSLDIIQRSIDKTLEISRLWPKAKPKMVVHLGGMSLNLLKQTSHGLDELSTHDEMMAIAIHNFKKLDFSPDAIDIIPENLPPRPWYLGGQWYQYGFAPFSDMVKFCEATNLKMTYDICHAHLQCEMEGSSLLDYTRRVMPYVSHMHISDATGISGEGVQIFEGDLDFKGVFNIAEEYDFSWVTEIWSGHLHNGTASYKALSLLESHFNL